MRRPFVAANWKMHGTASFVEAYLEDWRKTGPRGVVDVVICPPLAYLDRVAAAWGDHGVQFGVQAVHAEPSGAYTGEHAAEMARDLGATYAIVGHSERRQLFAESDAVVAAKFVAARRAGLMPVLCVGETLAERRAGGAEAKVLAQLDGVLGRPGAKALDADFVVAYEPVWAIGTGETATPTQAQRMHGTIRARLGEVGDAFAQSVRIVYGGSVNVDNAEALFTQTDIDGGLVGGASLDAAAFAAICRVAGRRTDS
ncbi:MAG: triose-phosphate isomerase [Gammaproteobacteria bacterium]|nr:triose-phosphate isomerase [Gammaproteobacteria bacterium]